MFRPSLESLETRETPAAHADLYMNVWVSHGEAPESAAHVRHRMFAIVDRTQMRGDSGHYAGSHALYQDVTIPAVDGNTVYVGTANGGVWKTTDGGAGGPTTVLQRLANPALPAEGGVPTGTVTFVVDGVSHSPTGGDSFYGTGVYKSVDSGRTW